MQNKPLCDDYMFHNKINLDLQNSQILMLQNYSKSGKHFRSASMGQVTSDCNTIFINNAEIFGEKQKHSRTLSHGQATENEKYKQKLLIKTDFLLPLDYEINKTSASSDMFIKGHKREESKTESVFTLRQVKIAKPMWNKVRFWRQNENINLLRLRTIIPNHMIHNNIPKFQHPNKNFATNEIQTTKYTLLSFLPKNLLEQFHRFGNLYFLFILLLNWVPQINAFGKEIAMLPVLFVLGVTAIKDAFEDRRRYQSDRRINNSSCTSYDSERNCYSKIRWKDLKVGDFVYISGNEIIPADILLLKSSNECGLAYIESSNLDGESCLKQRKIVNNLHKNKSEFYPPNFDATVECDLPTTKIYRFHGSLIYPNGEQIPLGIENLLLRDCVLKNTDSVEGLVIYAGHETKAMLNNGGPRYKHSKLEKRINADIIWCVILLITFCFIGAISSGVWLSAYSNICLVPFLSFPEICLYTPAYSSFLVFWTFVIILQVLIPISMYVTIEIVKLGQIYHIQNDLELYDSSIDKRIECRALNITEELGQIKYIFSDKTGTLTENKMMFHRCSIFGQDYFHATNPYNKVMCLQQNLDDTFELNPQLQQKIEQCEKLSMNSLLETDSVNTTIDYSQKLEDFFITLAICNTVIINKHTYKENQHSVTIGGNTELIKPIYEAESPDELALVNAAYKYNFCLLKRTHDKIYMTVPGRGLLEFELLHILPFDSFRKCMSVIIRHPATNVITLYIKGSDTAICSSLAPSYKSDIQQAVWSTQQHANNYAKKGLRILFMAKRNLSLRQYENWLIKYHQAEISLINKELLLRESYKAIETDLELIGATGIEDCLQEGVPETVELLRNAGINIWILTGDHQETAINVAFSCKLFNSNMMLFNINARSKNTAESSLKFYLEKIKNISFDITPALVIDGKSLIYILDVRAGLHKLFLALCRQCSAVLCCRITPLQKAFVIKIVKEELGATTLAIGDGANDVSMIQTADVGIGISGVEGRQAVMSSDFSIARFKFLKQLLLVHGHWCYDRLARMTFVFVLFWFQLYCGFSGTVVIDQVYLMMFNLLFTSLPPITLGIYDQHIPASLLLSIPYLYNYGQNFHAYQHNSLWIILANALYQSIAIFFVAAYAYHDSSADLTILGTTVISSCIIVMLLYIAIESYSWTYMHFISSLMSFVIFFSFSLIYNSVCYEWTSLSSSYCVMQHCMKTAIFWFILLLSCVVALLPHFIIHIFKIVNYRRNIFFQNTVTENESCLISWSKSTSHSFSHHHEANFFKSKEKN